MKKDGPYCKKEFLTDAPESSTSCVVSFSGEVQWGRNSQPEQLDFLEISSCHERARLHRTYEMSADDWIQQVERLRNHINDYIEYLVRYRKGGEGLKYGMASY